MNYDIHKISITKEFGVRYAKSKFNEVLLVEYRTTHFEWHNFPDMYEAKIYAELLKFYEYDRAHFKYFQQICVASFIDEGYKLKENYLKEE